MKTKTSQNQGINMTIEDVRAKIAQKKEQHAKPQARKEKLELSETSPTRRKPRFIPRDGISSSATHPACSTAYSAGCAAR